MTEVSYLSVNLYAIGPILILSLTGFLVLTVSLVLSSVSRSVLLALSLAGVVASLLFSFELWGSNESAFAGMVVSDNYALAFNAIFLLSAGLSMLLAVGEHEKGYLLYAEYFAVTLFATVGMILMAASSNLLVIFLGLETLSISLYVLAGLKRSDSRSLEAAFKYFLLGAFASAFLLYGIAFIYGAIGSLDVRQVSVALASPGFSAGPLLLLGGLLIIIGLGFKVAVVPFHMWAPDVYQGAPTPIAAFMSTGSKAAGFAALLRVLYLVSNGSADWGFALTVLAILTMFLGNISAIVQTNVKRMLAYSSVAHAGYILVGVIAWNETGAASVIFYLLAYTFMNIGAFGIISYFSSSEKEIVDLSDFRGLGLQRPLPALMMAVFMFSLAGLPPTAGFMGKFYLFSAAVKSGHIALVVFGVINSMISLYYYLGVVVMMFMKESESKFAIPRAVPALTLSLLIALAGSLGIGIFPSYLMDTFKHIVGRIL